SPRLGIIVGRRFGNAVLRNRAKRVFRELARTTRVEMGGGKEFLIFPKRKALQSRPGTVREAWRVALRDAGLLAPCSG
ncbi:MAG: ribonuclease P protein component, partial [Nitrospirales bacterium]|nr:ribonuclease P protein component [Nitrospirales bacterium]